MLKRILPFILIGFFAGNSYAQQQQRLSTPATVVSSIAYPGTGKSYYAGDRKNEPARAIEFEEGAVTASYFVANINTYFTIPLEFSFSETESNTDNIGMRHRLLQQYYKGIPIEGLGYRVHERNGFVTSANGKAVRDINLNVNTVISEEQAFQFAVRHLQTTDTVFRNAEKLIVSKNFTYTPESFTVAYQFDMDVSLIERWRISIDARTGEVINKVSLVNTCFEVPNIGPPLPYKFGLGSTRYYGNQNIRIEQLSNGTYRLVGETEHGGKIGTYNARNFRALLVQVFNIPKVDFLSMDTTFNSLDMKPAVSTQWGMEQVYEYFYNRHNRNSFDNIGSEISSFVHVDNNYNNAFWNGRIMAFGDGNNNNPPVELDIISHEFTHGVTQYEAALQYTNESGALNESFSDIFGKAVEFDVFGDSATWQVGKYFKAGGLRDMSNPNLKNQPDTYKGYLWHTGSEDYGGVHYNSGVQNFWFYLLCEGGSGTNDHGVSYSVNRIGMDTAVSIAYRNLTEYLGTNSDYLDSRIGSLLATVDLYGKNSTAYQEVDKAWDAVGVIDEPIITNFELYDITATTVKIRGNLQPRGNSPTFHFEYGTTPSFGNSSPIYEYVDNVDGILKGLQSEKKYYVRLVATNENGSTYSAPIEFTTVSLAPLVNLKHTIDITETSATLYGRVNPNSLLTSYYFEYGLTPAFGLVTPTIVLPDTTEFVDVSEVITALQPRQIYFYRLIATNDFTTITTETRSLITAVKPVITSFYPVIATIDSEVTITGEHFNINPAKNEVNFGATKATVLSASATEIKVQVPKGASFGMLSVRDTESGLIAESIQEFVPTFTGEFTDKGLQHRATFNDKPYERAVVMDMDGDGKPDIVGAYNAGFTVFLNVNSGEDITNASFVKSSFPSESPIEFLALVDLDGNGKKDIVARYSDGLRIYPNKSVPGFIFFDIPVDLPIGYLRHLEFKDFDSDGHIDISGIREQLMGDTGLFTIFRNENPKDILLAENFSKRYEHPILYYVDALSSADINNDGRPDIIATAHDSTQFSIFFNKSAPRFFDFNEYIFTDTTRGRFAGYVAHDLNQDGLKDIISFSPSEDAEKSLHIFKNSQTSSTITLDKSIVILNTHTTSIQPGDIDGDGIVDLMIGLSYGNFLFVKNNTTLESHFADSLFSIEFYGTNEGSSLLYSELIVNDLNGDGRPDVINNTSEEYYYTFNQIQVWQNAPNDCPPDPSLIKLHVTWNSATIILPDNTLFDQYEIYYTRTDNYQSYPVSSPTITGLQSGRSYTLRVRAKCYLGYSNYQYIDFTTECRDLSSFNINSIGTDRISIFATNISSIEIEYSQEGKDDWKVVPLNAVQITGLLPGTSYDLRYRGRCPLPVSFNYTTFTTLCPTLSTLSISNLVYNSAVVNATSNFVGEPHFEYGTDNLNWSLVDESGTMHALIPGQKYFVRGRLACTDTHSDYITTSFTTPCPKVSMLSLNTITPFSTLINWQDASATGSYLLTYSLADGSGATTIETHSTAYYLEGLRPGTQYKLSVAPVCLGAEDFTSTLFTTVCYAPYNLIADGITHTTTELSWEDHFGGYPYFIDYSIVGSNGWKTIETPLTSLKLENLRPGTEYEVRAHIDCPSETPPYASVRFKTSLYGETKFFPNPTDGIVTIHPSINLIGNNFDLYDNTGRRVATGQLHDYTIDMSGLPAGNYILKIVGEEPMKIVKY